MKVGRHTYMDAPVLVHRYHGAGEDTPDITIGNYCSISQDVEFLPGGMHDTVGVSTFPLGRILPGIPVKAELRGPITIGHDVWIGRGARILGGSTIGNGAIIGAYTVVAGEVPDYHTCVGNPAVRWPRHHHLWVKELNAIAWWEWPDGDPRLADVHNLTLARFIERHFVCGTCRGIPLTEQGWGQGARCPDCTPENVEPLYCDGCGMFESSCTCTPGTSDERP